MRNTPERAESNNRRKDTGSGEYWNLLNANILREIFYSLAGSGLLGQWRNAELGRSGVRWDPGTGIGTLKRSDFLFVLAARTEGLQAIRNALDILGGLSDPEKIKDEVGLEAYMGFYSALAKVIMEHVKICRVDGIPARQVADFKRRHLVQIGSKVISPMYVLRSVNTVDTGDVGLVLLQSVATFEDNTKIPSSHPSLVNAEAHDNAKQDAPNGRFAEALSTMRRTFPQPKPVDSTQAMDEMIINPLAGAGSILPNDLMQSTDQNGTVDFHRPTDQPSAPVFTIGGPGNVRIDRAETIVNGTRQQSYLMEGLASNPASVFPSSYFFPNKPLLFQPYGVVQDVIDNPSLLIGIIAMLALSDKKSNKHLYTYNYKTLPLAITDNEEIERKLFGE